MNTPVSPSFLKQEAKKLCRSKGIKLTKAYDEVVKVYGYTNYKHYLNVSKQNSPSLPRLAVKRKPPTIPFTITSGFKKMFKDVFELLDKSDNEAHSGLVCTIKNDEDSFKRLQAAQALFNNFDVPLKEVSSLLKYIPEDHLMMIWPVLNLDEDSKSKLKNLHMSLIYE